jgi:glycosyltransferase involved in cell wall biosynthesis
MKFSAVQPPRPQTARAVRNGQFYLDSQPDVFQAGAMLGLASCAAVIPCFNEGATIAALVGAARQHLPVIIVVDDGSTDDTPAQAARAGAMVLSHGRNLGKGAALRSGLSQALKRGFEWAVTMDGDGQHLPADVPALLWCAEESGALLVVGNRMHQARAMPWLRRRVNIWMSRKLSRRAGRILPDTQSGFRVIHLPTWSALPLNTERFEVESEMLMAFLAADRRVAFAPIQVVAPGRNSHIRPVADTLRWWKWWRGPNRPRNVPVELAIGVRDEPRQEFNRALIR